MRGVPWPVVSPIDTSVTPSSAKRATSAATEAGSTAPSNGQPSATETTPTSRNRPAASRTISATWSHCAARVVRRLRAVCASVAETSRLISSAPCPASRSATARATARTLGQVAL